MEKCKKAAHQEHPKMYYHPKGSKKLWLSLPHKCIFLGVRLMERDKACRFELNISGILPSLRMTKLLSATINKGPCWSSACSLRSYSLSEEQLKTTCLLQISLVIYMALWVLVRLDLQCAEKSSCPGSLVA